MPTFKRQQGAEPALSHRPLPNPGLSIHTVDTAVQELAHGNAGPESQWIPQHQHGPSSSMTAAAAAAGRGQSAATMQQPSSKESLQEHVNGSVLASYAAAVGKVRVLCWCHPASGCLGVIVIAAHSFVIMVHDLLEPIVCNEADVLPCVPDGALLHSSLTTCTWTCPCPRLHFYIGNAPFTYTCLCSTAY